FSLGVAVLGTFVVQQLTSNIPSQLTQAGVPAPLGSTIARKIGSAGALASQVRLAGRLPLPQAALHQAFVDALHGSFLMVGIVLLVVAVLVGFLLGQRQPATKTVSTQPPVSTSGPSLDSV